MLDSIYTKEQDDFIRESFELNRTHSIIAQLFYTQFGRKVSRNAMIGRSRRLGLVKPSVERKALVQKAKPFHQSKRLLPRTTVVPLSIPKEKPDPFKMLAGTFPVAFMDLTMKHCRWPIDQETGPIFYCGEQVTEISDPYCVCHYRMSVGPGTRFERMALRC